MDLSSIELDINTIANGGEGIGRLPDGRAVFVPFTLPGETVKIQLIEEKRGYVRGALQEVIKPSPMRIEARCKHFGVCGGCQFQHLKYPDQLIVKTGILKDVLSRVGGLSDIPVNPIVPSASEWDYRNHVQYHLDPNGSLGYQRHSSHEVVRIEECFLPVPGFEEIRKGFVLDSQVGIDRVSLRRGMDGDLLIILEGDSTDLPEMEIDFPASVVHLSSAGRLVLAGNDHLMMKVKDRIFKVSAESFFQVNISVAEKMVDHVLSLLPQNQVDCLLDLFCGVGLFSAFTAGRAKRLIGVESGNSACMDFAENLDEFDHVDLYEGLTDAILPQLDIQPDVVIVDPPRAGIGRPTLDALIKMMPKQLIYVSCDQATLARDAARLVKNGFNFSHITPFDLFPQTSHIESISLFEVTD
jgi:23S rRNA (uracil1939-C5)-methyltransferase